MNIYIMKKMLHPIIDCRSLFSQTWEDFIRSMTSYWIVLFPIIKIYNIKFFLRKTGTVVRRVAWNCRLQDESPKTTGSPCTKYRCHLWYPLHIENSVRLILYEYFQCDEGARDGIDICYMGL